MKMVKTFMKTQHQHVMPPEKGNCANQTTWADPWPVTAGQLPSDVRTLGGQGEGAGQHSIQAQHNPSPVPLYCHLKFKGQFPHDSPPQPQGKK